MPPPGPGEAPPIRPWQTGRRATMWTAGEADAKSPQLGEGVLTRDGFVAKASRFFFFLGEGLAWDDLMSGVRASAGLSDLIFGSRLFRLLADPVPAQRDPVQSDSPSPAAAQPWVPVPDEMIVVVPAAGQADSGDTSHGIDPVA